MCNRRTSAHARSFDRDTACRKIEISADYRQMRMTIGLLQLSEKHSNRDAEEEKTIFSQMSGLSRMIFRYVIRYLRDYLKQKGKLPRVKTNTRETFKANIKNSCILSEYYTVRSQRDERKEVHITDTLSNHCRHGWKVSRKALGRVAMAIECNMILTPTFLPFYISWNMYDMLMRLVPNLIIQFHGSLTPPEFADLSFLYACRRT